MQLNQAESQPGPGAQTQCTNAGQLAGGTTAPSHALSFNNYYNKMIHYNGDRTRPKRQRHEGGP